jgi:hypothetical protein
MAYGYWLYHKDSRIRNYTGSLAANHGLLTDKLNRASFNPSSSQMFLLARTYLEVLSDHFQESLSFSQSSPGVKVVPALTIVGTYGDKYSITELADCLCRIHYGNHHGLAMVCERYICRCTPASAATCLPVKSLVPALIKCWFALFSGDPKAARLRELLEADAAAGESRGWKY